MEIIRLDNLSRIKVETYSVDSYKILFFEVSGTYNSGSEGNNDGLFLFSTMVAHYFIYEPITVILNLSNLEYSWGNTILKSIDFFSEIGRDVEEKKKRLILIPPNNNGSKLEDLINLLESNTLIVSSNNFNALTVAKKIVEDYLK